MRPRLGDRRGKRESDDALSVTEDEKSEGAERLTAWPLKVAEYEHQFKAIDEAQKIFVVREMMPKDIRREFLTGQ